MKALDLLCKLAILFIACVYCALFIRAGYYLISILFAAIGILVAINANLRSGNKRK